MRLHSHVGAGGAAASSKRFLRHLSRTHAAHDAPMMSPWDDNNDVHMDAASLGLRQLRKLRYGAYDSISRIHVGCETLCRSVT